MGIRQFIQKPARDTALPVGIYPPVGGMADDRPPPRPGQADIGQAPFFLQPLVTAFVQGALVREDAFLPARQEHRVEFQSFGAVQGHQADPVGFDSSPRSPSPARRDRGNRPASRNPPARGPVPAGFRAGQALRAICPASTSRCSRSRPAWSRPSRHGHRVPACRASARSRATIRRALLARGL